MGFIRALIPIGLLIFYLPYLAPSLRLCYTKPIKHIFLSSRPLRPSDILSSFQKIYAFFRNQS